MKTQKKKQVTNFAAEGRLLEVLGKSPLKPKYLRLATAEGEQVLKLNKELRPLILENQVTVGSWIAVSGKETYKPNQGTRKRKIYAIEGDSPLAQRSEKPESKPKKVKKEAILVCQKSSCCKRGGKAVYQAAIAAVTTGQLCDRVQVKATGCMGKCKKGPCLVMQGDKSRHLGIKPEQVQKLIVQKYQTPPTETPEIEVTC